MNAVRRALTAVAVSGTALAGVAVAGMSAAAAAAPPAPTALSITAPAKVTYGSSATVKGTLTSTGKKAVSGATVTLDERAPGATGWTASGTQATDSTGAVSFSVSPPKGVQVQLVYAGSSTLKPSTSATATINVGYGVTATITKNSNGTYTISVTVAPMADKQKVLLQLKGKTGQWSTLQTTKLAGASAASFTVTAPKAKGTYSYHVLKLAAHGFLAGTSNVVQLTV